MSFLHAPKRRERHAGEFCQIFQLPFVLLAKLVDLVLQCMLSLFGGTWKLGVRNWLRARNAARRYRYWNDYPFVASPFMIANGPESLRVRVYFQGRPAPAVSFSFFTSFARKSGPPRFLGGPKQQQPRNSMSGRMIAYTSIY